MFDDQLPRLDGLLSLSRDQGLDVRATLLRVLTDLFVDGPQRSSEDVARYAELAAHLVEQTDEETRVIVARKLGPCAFAPRAVLDRLLAGEPRVVALVAAASPLLNAADLWALAADGGPVVHAAIAARADLDRDLTRFLARRGHPLVAEALVANRDAPLDREAIAALAPQAVEVEGLAAALARRQGVRVQWLAPLFLDLDAAGRRQIIETYRQEASATRFTIREAQVSAPKLMLDAMEGAALTHNHESLAAGLAAAFALDAGIAARLVGDRGGEALAIALAALAMPGDQAARLLMFVHEEIGRSVERMRLLVEIVETMPRPAATRLLRAFAVPQARPSSGRHAPFFADPGARARGTGRDAQSSEAAPGEARDGLARDAARKA